MHGLQFNSQQGKLLKLEDKKKGRIYFVVFGWKKNLKKLLPLAMVFIPPV